MGELREVFKLFDKDGNGSISVDELEAIMKQLGQSPSADELQIMLNSVDANANGVIDFDEFCCLMRDYLYGEQPSHEQEMMETFKVFDRDGNGFITTEELKMAMINLGERLTDEELRLMIEAADTDRNGMIDYQEFLAMMRTK